MTKQVCTFTLNDMLFGIEVLFVQEILRPQPMTRVPLAPSVVRGLINLRGQIITAVDLRERLGLPRAPKYLPGMNLVVRLPDETVSFIVDDVGEVLDLPDNQFEDVPVTLQQSIRAVTSGVYKLKDRVLLHLDAAAAAAPTQENN